MYIVLLLREYVSKKREKWEWLNDDEASDFSCVLTFHRKDVFLLQKGMTFSFFISSNSKIVYALNPILIGHLIKINVSY